MFSVAIVMLEALPWISVVKNKYFWIRIDDNFIKNILSCRTTLWRVSNAVLTLSHKTVFFN